MPYSFEHMRQYDSWFLDEKGVSYENTESYLGHQLNFCGCGRPEDALLFICDVLHALDVKDGNNDDWEKRNERLKKLWHLIPDGIMYLVYYFLDDKGLTEHGGSVPGWLTDKGLTMMRDLDVYKRELDVYKGELDE